MARARQNGHSKEGNHNNSADVDAADLDGANGDRLTPIDNDDLSTDTPLEQLRQLIPPPETGQGDARQSPETCTTAKRCLRFLLWSVLNLLLFLSAFLLVIAPLIIKVFPEIPKHIIYLNAFKIPYHVNLTDPSSVDLNYARNFYHQTEEGITVGVWHILPKSYEQEGLSDKDYDDTLRFGKPIILYCHGNTGTRGTSHRVDMYKLLAAQDFHVIALDYRGYGDSTGSPTSENGVMTDVVSLYNWIKQYSKGSPIYVWGHSLGTGIATKAVRYLIEQENDYPQGLVLESPFTNIFEAALEHPFSIIFRKLWWFDDLFLETMHTYGIYLQSDDHICHIDIPVMILHAEDDIVVPFLLGERLYERSKKRPERFARVTFHRFAYDRGLKHKYICNAEELPDLIRTFTVGCDEHRESSKNPTQYISWCEPEL